MPFLERPDVADDRAIAEGVPLPYLLSGDWVRLENLRIYGAGDQLNLGGFLALEHALGVGDYLLDWLT